MKLKSLVLVIVSLAALQTAAVAQTIHLSVAASMTNACNDIIASFTASHPDITIQPNYASSGSLAKQIEQGAPADIYVSANPKWMQYLVAKALIAPETDRVFAFNTLVFVSTHPMSEADMTGLVKLERIAIGTPASVPAGQYARQAMEKSGVYAALEKNNALVMAKDVRQALLYADQGEVDGAFVYRTDAMLATSAAIIFTVPPELYDKVSYPLGLTVDGAGKDSARSFYEYMTGPEAAVVLKKYGFLPVQ